MTTWTDIQSELNLHAVWQTAPVQALCLFSVWPIHWTLVLSLSIQVKHDTTHYWHYWSDVKRLIVVLNQNVLQPSLKYEKLALQWKIVLASFWSIFRIMQSGFSSIFRLFFLLNYPWCIHNLTRKSKARRICLNLMDKNSIAVFVLEGGWICVQRVLFIL